MLIRHWLELYDNFLFSNIIFKCIEHNYTKKKPMFHIFFSMFKLNDKVNTSVTTAVQSWPNYIGAKTEKTQVCLTNPVYALFP